MKRLLRIYFHPAIACIFVFGLGVLVFSILAEPVLTPFWARFLSVIAVSFIAVALTAPISQFFQSRTLEQHVELLRGAQDSGIIYIFTSRVGEWGRFQKSIERELSRADRILMAGIALPRIFHELPMPEPIEIKMYDTETEIKLLLLNPDGASAKERAKIEIGRGTIASIQRTILNLAAILKTRAESVGLKCGQISSQQVKGIGMGVHSYDFPPIAFSIITENCMFLEQYHFGRLSSARRGECIGGRVPLIHYALHSRMYQVMAEHFDYVWKNKSNDITLSLVNSP